jgi:hypothetical protein
MTVRVARLGLGGIAEQTADVGIALDVRLSSEVEVAAVGLGLPSEGVLEVLMGLRSLEVGHGHPP